MDPSFEVYLVGQETIHIDLYYLLTRKSESQHVIFVGRSNWSILYLSPLCQTLSNAFITSRKAATTCSSLLKLSMMDWV